MATDASGIGGGQVVIAIHVALRALHGRVGAGERESSSGVIKGRAVPRGRVMALLARRREAGLHMVRIGCSVKILDVARRAIGSRPDELAIDVTLGAGYIHVRTSQRKFRERIVIKGRRIPGAGVVASLASGRESRLRVRRIAGFVEVRHVTADAGCRRPYKLAAHMASVAVQGGVRPRQGKPRELQVVELCAHPVVHRMALFAGRRQIQCNVIDPHRFRVHEIPLVAGEAHRRKTLELADRCALMTGIAVHRGVSPDERETIQVLIDLLDGNMPTLYGMALFAVGAHLPLVNVRVTIRALGTHIGEHHLGVALGASHALMHSAQRVLGGVVVELRDGADGLPAAQRVTVLAGNAEASVGTSRIGRRLPTRRLSAGEHRKYDRQMKQNCRSQDLPNPFWTGCPLTRRKLSNSQ